jgi:hypothetical protein
VNSAQNNSPDFKKGQLINPLTDMENKLTTITLRSKNDLCLTNSKNFNSKC